MIKNYRYTNIYNIRFKSIEQGDLMLPNLLWRFEEPVAVFVCVV